MRKPYKAPKLTPLSVEEGRALIKPEDEERLIAAKREGLDKRPATLEDVPR